MVISVGISFNLIIIRVKQGIAVGNTDSDLDSNTVPLRFITVPPTQGTAVDTGTEVVISTTMGEEQDQDEDVLRRKSQLPPELTQGRGGMSQDTI
jgi:beta-lactam-binding protein with PASTA domain